MILRAKEARLGLDDIRDMLTAPSPARRTEILRRHRADLAHRIAQAQASLELIDCDHDDFTSCPHFQAMVADRVGVGAPAHVPV